MAYGDRPVSRLNRRRRFLPRADAVDEVDIVHEGVVDVPRPPGDFRAVGGYSRLTADSDNRFSPHRDSRSGFPALHSADKNIWIGHRVRGALHIEVVFESPSFTDCPHFSEKGERGDFESLQGALIKYITWDTIR